MRFLFLWSSQFRQLPKTDVFTMTDNDLGRLAACLEALPLRLPWDSCLPKKVRGWQDRTRLNQRWQPRNSFITFLKTLTNNLFLVCWALGHITFTSNHSVLEFQCYFQWNSYKQSGMWTRIWISAVRKYTSSWYWTNKQQNTKFQAQKFTHIM